MSGKFTAEATKFSQSKPFKCNYHSNPSKALKRRILFTNVAIHPRKNYQHGCFTLFSCANNARNWHLALTVCWTFPINDKTGRQKSHYDQDQQMIVFVVLLLWENLEKESHLHPGQDKKSGEYFHQGAGDAPDNPPKSWQHSVRPACRKLTETASASDCLRTTTSHSWYLSLLHTFWGQENFHNKNV